MADSRLTNTASFRTVHTFYNSSGKLWAIGRNTSNSYLIIESTTDIATTAFTQNYQSGTDSLTIAGVTGVAHIGSGVLMIIAESVTTGKTNTYTYRWRRWDASGSGSWVDGSWTTLTTASTELQSVCSARSAVGAFSNGEAIAFLRSTDGSSMGNPTLIMRFWTWTSGGGWVDEGIAFDYDEIVDRNSGPMVVDSSNRAWVALHRFNSLSSGTPAHYIGFRQSDSAMDSPSTTTDNELLTSTLGANHGLNGWVNDDGSTEEMIYSTSHTTGSVVYSEGTVGWPPGARTHTTPGVSHGHQNPSLGLVISSVDDKVNAFGAVAGTPKDDVYWVKSTNTNSAASWGTAEQVYSTTNTVFEPRGQPINTYVSGSNEFCAIVVSDPDNSGNTRIIEVQIAGSAATTYTKTVLLGAAVKSTLTKTLSTSAAIQQAFTKTLSTDAAIANAYQVIADMDAAVRATLAQQLNVDAAVLDTIATTVNTDAALQELRSISADVDAALQRAFTALANLDAAVLATGLTQQATLDAALQTFFTASADLDAAIQQLGLTRTTDLQAAVQATSQITAGLNAQIQGIGTFNVTTDFDAAIQKLGNTIAVLMAAAVQTRTALSVATDAAVLATLSQTASADAAVLATLSRTITADAALMQVGSVSVDLSAGLHALGLTKSVSTDAALLATLTKVADVDAALQQTSQASADLDALIKAIYGKTVTLDALLAGQATISADLDAAIQTTLTAQASLNAAVANLFSISVDTDAAVLATLVKQVSLSAAVFDTLTRAVDLQAAIQQAFQISTLLGAAVLKQATLQTLTVDAAITAIGNQLSVGTNAVVLFRGVLTLSADAALFSTLVKQVTFDALVDSGTYTPPTLGGIASTRSRFLHLLRGP